MRSIYSIGMLSLLFISSGCKEQEVDPTTQVKAHTYTVTNWYWSSPHHYVNLDVPEITSSNLQTVGVMVYYSTQNNVWTSVPYTVYGTIHNYHMGFRYSTGLVEVTWLYDGTSAGDNPNTYYGTNVKCKVVVVPSSARIANDDLDWNNYEEVCSRFDLAE